MAWRTHGSLSEGTTRTNVLNLATGQAGKTNLAAAVEGDRQHMRRTMAAWQFSVFLVEQGATAPVLVGDGWHVPPLAEPLIGKALVSLNMSLGIPTTVTDDWLIFGADKGNRVDVAVEETGKGDISAHVDVRVDSSPFVALLCRLADEVDCLFFSPESKTFIEANSSALLVAIEKSQAAAFCEAPKEFLRKLQQGC